MTVKGVMELVEMLALVAVFVFLFGPVKCRKCLFWTWAEMCFVYPCRGYCRSCCDKAR